MAQLPAVSVAATSGAESHVVRVSLGDRIRTFEVAAGRLKNRLVAVLIAEFGMAQPDAHAHAEQVLADAQTGAGVESIRAEKAADYERMAAELGRTQAALAKATNDLVQAHADLGAVQTQLAEAEAEMDRLRTQAAELQAQVEHLTAPQAG